MALNLVLIVCATAVVQLAASNNYNYNPYRYDMTVPQYTPDGRLLQVEYATVAADHSSPIVAVRVDQDLVLMACRRQKGSMVDRLTMLPYTAPGTVIALSGLLADSLAVFRKLQKHLLSEFRQFNGKYCPTPMEMAAVISSVCQENTFAGGRRVYGATSWVGGFHHKKWVLYRTDPSGAVQREELDCGSVTVLGGGESGRTLQRQCEKCMSNKGEVDPRQSIRRVIQTLMAKDEHDEDSDVEVLLLSASKGILKLTPEHVQLYLEQE